MRLIFESPDTGTKIVRTVSGSNPPSTVEVRFEPLSSSDRLIGQPAAWCNTPSVGQPLVFDVPTPATPSDPDTDDDLIISKAAGGNAIRVPILVKHNP